MIPIIKKYSRLQRSRIFMRKTSLKQQIPQKRNNARRLNKIKQKATPINNNNKIIKINSIKINFNNNN